MDESTKKIIHEWFCDMIRYMYPQLFDAEKRKQVSIVLAIYELGMRYHSQLIQMVGSMNETDMHLWEMFVKWSTDALKKFNVKVPE